MRPYGELGASWPLAKPTEAWLAIPPILLILGSRRASRLGPLLP